MTVDLKVLDGGAFRMNALRKGGTGPGCQMNVLIDGGTTASYWYGDLQYLKATH